MAQDDIPSWSKTAASNATADPNINWAEGQAPSSVNDSARAMMAAVARWRDDIAGTLTTAGTTTAYTLTTNQVFDSLAAMSGQTLRVKFNAANGAAPTLNVDGLGAKAIQSVFGTGVATGAIKASSIHDLVYDNGNAVWILVGTNVDLSAALSAPSGTIMLFRQTAAPTGWTKDTSNFNNYAIRVTTGTVSSGGSTGFTSVFTSRTITQAHLPNVNLTHTLTASGSVLVQTSGLDIIAPHAASGSAAAQSGGGSSSFFPTGSFGGVSGSLTGAAVAGTVALGGSGTGLDLAVTYVDSIFATKD